MTRPRKVHLPSVRPKVEWPSDARCGGRGYNLETTTLWDDVTCTSCREGVRRDIRSGRVRLHAGRPNAPQGQDGVVASRSSAGGVDTRAHPFAQPRGDDQ
jgi:hypothetical protein